MAKSDIEKQAEVCEQKFIGIDEKLEAREKVEDTLFTKIDEVHRCLKDLSGRLFEDNGTKSLQTRINENAIWCSVIKWLTITISAAFIIQLIGLAVYLIYKCPKGE